jgi:hypothetical protein
VKRDDTPDLTVIAADDALLDTLARGEPAPDDDKLAGVLAAWRADLDDDQPADFDVAAMLAELPDETESQGDPVPVQAVPSAAPRRWRPGPRARRYLTGLAAAGLLVGGLALGAGQAGPESPLWPITRVLYPERSDLRLAEHNIGLAREAAAAGRYADARRTLDKAAGDVERVDDPELAGRLRAQIEEIRRTLPPVDAVVPDPVIPTPSVPVSPPATVPATPPAGGQPGVPPPPGGGTNPQPPGEGVIPDVPDIPVPTLPIPIPTLPLPAVPLLPTS